MATIEEISSLLDSKLNENLNPINEKIDKLQSDMIEVKESVSKILRFVSVGNEDIVKELEGKKPKLSRAH